jgi:type II secretory pathway pseudopilin PulG
MNRAQRRRGAATRNAGFTYIGLLFAVAILGITLATVGVVWSTQIRRDKEVELLFSGDQIRTAIGRYLRGGGQYPQELNDLLEDKRFPVVRRYLRRIYPDPMTSDGAWALIAAPEGGIMGVASRSQGKPIKVTGFSAGDAAFEKMECYCEWKFIYSPRTRGRRRAIPGVLQPLPQSFLKSLPQSGIQPQAQPRSEP